MLNLAFCVYLILGIASCCDIGFLRKECTSESRLSKCRHCDTPESCVSSIQQQQVIQAITQITNCLALKKSVIIHDNDTEFVANGVFQWWHNRTSMVLNTDQDPVDYDPFRNQLPEELIILICSLPCVSKVFNQVKRYINTKPRRLDITYLSQWLIICDASCQEMIENLNLDIDNLVLLIIPKMKNNKKLQNMVYCDIHTPCYLNNLITLHTLIPTTDGRLFREISAYPSNGPLTSNMDIYPNRKYGLNGRNLIVAVELWDPFVMLKASSNHTKKYSGITIDILDEMARSLNFSYQLIRPPDNQFGAFNNGTWTGMVRQLQRQEVDIVASLTIVESRAKVIDFTYPFYHYYNIIAMKKPGLRERRWFTILNIFQWPVLLTVTVITTIAAVFIYFSERYNSRRSSNVDIACWVMHVYGILIVQSGTIAPASKFGCIILVSFSFMAIVLSATYTGNLVSSFMITDNEAPITSLVDLVTQTDYTWGAQGGGSLLNNIQESNSIVMQNVWKGMKEFQQTDPDVLSPFNDVHFKKLRGGGYVYITDTPSIDNLLDCGITMGKEQFFPSSAAFGVQKGSPLRQLLSDRIMTFMENGMMERWLQVLNKHGTSCEEEAKRIIAAEGLQLVYLEAAFCILLIGLVLSILSLILEFSVYKCNSRVFSL